MAGSGASQPPHPDDAPSEASAHSAGATPRADASSSATPNRCAGAWDGIEITPPTTALLMVSAATTLRVLICMVSSPGYSTVDFSASLYTKTLLGYCQLERSPFHHSTVHQSGNGHGHAPSPPPASRLT